MTNREFTGRRARFFALGRRISEVANVASFMKQSKFKQRYFILDMLFKLKIAMCKKHMGLLDGTEFQLVPCSLSISEDRTEFGLADRADLVG